MSQFVQFADVTGLSRHVPKELAARSQHLACDLLEGVGLAEAVRVVAPDIVVHAQALSDVDHCEEQPKHAWALNVQTTHNVVEALKPIGAPLISISTSYVFDGMKAAPYVEADPPHPTNVYGQTKLEGETITLSYARGFVVRTGNLFGPGRENFCDHAILQLRAGKPVEAFVDQLASPTYTVDLAHALGQFCQRVSGFQPDEPRLYHVANAGRCSRFAFVQRVADLLECSHQPIHPISMGAQRRPARRPANAALQSLWLEGAIGCCLRSWEEALQDYVQGRWSPQVLTL